jgi:quercetin dioxygenase-like cupin family protein
MPITATPLQLIPLEQVTDKFSKRTYATERQMIVWGRMLAGAVATSHKHAEEQIFWVTSGTMIVCVEGAHYTCNAGDLFTVPAWAIHEVTFPVDTEYVSILSGVRSDLQPGQVPAHLLGYLHGMQ